MEVERRGEIGLLRGEQSGSAGGQSMKKIYLCPGWARDSSEQCLHEAPVGTTRSLCFGWPFVLWGVKRIPHGCRTVTSFFAGRKIGWVNTKNEVPCDFSARMSCGWSGLKCSCKESHCYDMRYDMIACSPMQSYPDVFFSVFSWLPQFWCSCRRLFILSSLLEKYWIYSTVEEWFILF